MPLFKYQAFNHKGNVVSGELEAVSLGELKDSLRASGLLLFKICNQNPTTLLSSLKSIFESSISDKTKIQFTNQLALLLRAGVPLLDAMNLIVLQFEGTFKKILTSVVDDLRGGVSFADALEKHPKVFYSLFTQLVRAGEASGNLEMVLDRLTSFLERSENVNKAISNAMAKPIFMGLVIVCVFIVSVVFVIPGIGGTLSQIGKTLPPLTQFMMDLSDFIRSYYLYLSIAIILAIATFKRWKSSETGRVSYDSFLLKVPKISELQKSRVVVQFSQTLGMLLEAGVNLSSALDIVNNVVDNAILQQALKVAREEIVKEGKIAKHLKNTQIFSPVSGYMIKTGEESGNLAGMLIKVGKDSETELIESVDNFVAAIDPIMTFAVGGIVLLLVLAILLPIMEMSDLSGI
jgi:type II secretory pathway component PulF